MLIKLISINIELYHLFSHLFCHQLRGNFVTFLFINIVYQLYHPILNLGIFVQWLSISVFHFKETLSDPCQPFKMEGLEKIVSGFHRCLTRSQTRLCNQKESMTFSNQFFSQNPVIIVFDEVLNTLLLYTGTFYCIKNIWYY